MCLPGLRRDNFILPGNEHLGFSKRENFWTEYVTINLSRWTEIPVVTMCLKEVRSEVLLIKGWPEVKEASSPLSSILTLELQQGKFKEL